MKAHGTRLILGLITATVTAADEQVLHLYGMNKADNQGFGGVMGKPRRIGGGVVGSHASDVSPRYW
jgi:hypothetical protein